MVCESKMVDFFMGGYVYIRNILDIKCALVGLFDPIVIFFISCLATSESSATLGQSISETEVVLLLASQITTYQYCTNFHSVFDEPEGS